MVLTLVCWSELCWVREPWVCLAATFCYDGLETIMLLLVGLVFWDDERSGFFLRFFMRSFMLEVEVCWG